MKTIMSISISVLINIYISISILIYLYLYIYIYTYLSILQQFASRNRQSCGELLIDFFGYFAWEFDYRHDTISVRSGSSSSDGGGSSNSSKSDKCEYCCWGMNDRLSIEDPFEIWYDVGHVLKVRLCMYTCPKFKIIIL
jgi:DNA polymerase sigma